MARQQRFSLIGASVYWPVGGPALILEVIVRDRLAVLDDRAFAPDRLA
jgi:hypothetical protein